MKVGPARNEFKHELVAISTIKEHPRNYRKHPDDQIDHIVQSIREHGFYRNVVIAKDGTILAGHGVVKASLKMGISKVPVIRVNLDPNSPKALKILTGDNEIAHLGEIDDRTLTELLKEVMKLDSLRGTGFDERMLANLVYVSRPASEIADFNAALEWVGLPSYQSEDGTLANDIYLIVVFKKKADRERFVEEKKIKIRDKRGDRKWSTIWPYVERNDLASVKFEGKKK